MRYLRIRLGNDSVASRIAWAFVTFLITFVIIVCVSYVFLPEGALRGRNPLQNWDESRSTTALAVQIFAFNLLSVAIIGVGSLFASRPSPEQPYFSTGYYAFFTLVVVNAITLGTWSFSVASDPVPLIDRLLGMLDLTHRSGLWEMAGQLLITCSLARIALVRTTGRSTEIRVLRETVLSRTEKLGLLVGLGMMVIGALVEGIAINR